jgi:hypothetical protein
MSEGEIIRRGIDRELAQHSAATEGDDWKEAWRQAFAIWKDRDDIEEVIAARRKRNRQRMERVRRQMRGKGAP